MLGLALALRKYFAKVLSVGLELASEEIRRRIEVLVQVTALRRDTAGSRLGVGTAIITVGRLGAGPAESRRRTSVGESERLFRYSSFQWWGALVGLALV